MYGGITVHPQVAINLGQWLSAKFAVQVSKWVYDWMSGKGQSAKLPYHLERHLINLNKIRNLDLCAKLSMSRQQSCNLRAARSERREIHVLR